MKKNIFILTLLFNSFVIFSQIGQNDAAALIGLPQATDINEINSILNPQVGSVVYNLDDEEIYRYTGVTNGWQKSSDDQNAMEVPMVVDVDVNGTTGDPTPILETNLEEVVQAIAPITSKAGRIFYPPSIEIDASTISTTDQTIDLYAEYTSQFTLSPTQSSKSVGAPDIPIYSVDDLYYYVTFADDTVFNIIGISAQGILTYRIKALPTDYNTLINIVFVVK